jgi:hypothetical protein
MRFVKKKIHADFRCEQKFPNKMHQKENKKILLKKNQNPKKVASLGQTFVSGDFFRNFLSDLKSA